MKEAKKEIKTERDDKRKHISINDGNTQKEQKTSSRRERRVHTGKNTKTHNGKKNKDIRQKITKQRNAYRIGEHMAGRKEGRKNVKQKEHTNKDIMKE